ncbi:hypothetical protein EMIT0P171_90218 [Pseudomonas sp. IT-P171]
MGSRFGPDECSLGLNVTLPFAQSNQLIGLGK